MGQARITGMDHIVLNVADVERSLEFYSGVLGLAPERVDLFREGKAGFPSVRIDAQTIIDLSPAKVAPATGPGANLNHFCLVTERAVSELAPELKAAGVKVLEGPAPRWGAQGMASSIYVEDPDGNVVELRCY